MSRSPSKLLWALVAVSAGAAVALHVTRRPSITEVGLDFLNHLRIGDAVGIASMFPSEELDAIGVTRVQAAEIVRRVVLPKAAIYTENVRRLTVSGRSVVFEKPKGDSRYVGPPTLLLAEPAPHEFVVSLGDLVDSVWALTRLDASYGRTAVDWKAVQRAGIEQVKSLGMRKEYDFQLHEAHPWPMAKATAGAASGQSS